MTYRNILLPAGSEQIFQSITTILQLDVRIIAELEKSETITGHDFRGIKAFAELNEKEFTGGVVLYSGKEVVRFGENIWAIPLCICGSKPITLKIKILR